MSNQEYIDREFEAYRKAEKAARDILDLAATESRSTTAEEDEAFDRAIAASEKATERIAKLTKLETDARAAHEARAQIQDAVAQTTSGAATGDKQRIWTEIQKVQEGLRSGFKVREDDAVIVDLPFDYAAIRDETRAIANFSDAAALYMNDFSTSVAVYARTASPWRELATIIPATNGRPLVLPNLTADVTTYTPGEGTAINESTPTLGGGTATPISYKALSYISSEAEEDEVIGLLGLIAKSQGRALGLAFGSAATTAVLAAATNGGTASGAGGSGTAVNTFFGYEDLIDIKYGLAVPYRAGGVYVMSNGALRKVRKFRDQNAAYFFQPSIGPGMPPTFDGNAVYEDPNLAAPASATKSVLFGDASAFVVKEAPLRVALSTEFRFNLDQVALRSVYRAGGAVPDAAAIAYLVSKNT